MAEFTNPAKNYSGLEGTRKVPKNTTAIWQKKQRAKSAGENEIFLLFAGISD